MRSVIIKVLYIIIIPIIIFDLVLILQTIIDKDKTPEIFGIKMFNIISDSMKPEINVDDLIIVKRVDEKELKVEDVVTYKKGEDIITHRISDIKNIYNTRIYLTKGDNNDVTDENSIIYDQIEGRYLFKIPKIGKLVNILKNKITFTIFLTILIILFILDRKKINTKIKRKEKRIQYDKENGNKANEEQQ